MMSPGKKIKSAVDKLCEYMRKGYTSSDIFPFIGPYVLLDYYEVKNIVLESTNYCNLRCPLCENKYIKRPKGFMSYKDYVMIIDQMPTLESVGIQVGEPLFNPETTKMLAYSAKKGIYTSMNTNGTFIDKYLNAILDSGVNTITIALDSIIEDEYLKSRVGGNFKKVIKNIESICNKKKMHNYSTWIQVMHIVTKSNEHMLDKTVEFVKKLGVDLLVLQAPHMGWIKEPEEVRKRIIDDTRPSDPAFIRYDEDYSSKFNVGGPCEWIDRCQVFWNGDITLCCFDMIGDYIVGNLHETEFQKLFNSQKYNDLRNKMNTPALPMCKTCGRVAPYGKMGKHINFHLLNGRKK